MSDNKTELIEKLKTSEVTVSFKKKDGTIRDMKCTLMESKIPKNEVANTSDVTKQRKKNEEVLAVFDLEKNEWRSFRWDSLITAN